jgi:hypothetical protein
MKFSMTRIARDNTIPDANRIWMTMTISKLTLGGISIKISLKCGLQVSSIMCFMIPVRLSSSILQHVEKQNVCTKFWLENICFVDLCCGKIIIKLIINILKMLFGLKCLRHYRVYCWMGGGGGSYRAVLTGD